MITQVEITRQARRDLGKAPSYIVAKFEEWLRSVQIVGLDEVRRRPGWHDEPLKGKRRGQRSIRLNIQYRAIYTITSDGVVELVRVEEVTCHDYRVKR